MAQPARNKNRTALVNDERAGRVGLRVQTVLRGDDSASLTEKRLYALLSSVPDAEAVVRDLMLLGAAASPTLLETKEMLIGRDVPMHAAPNAERAERAAITAPQPKSEVAASAAPEPRTAPTLSFGSTPRAAAR